MTSVDESAGPGTTPGPAETPRVVITGIRGYDGDYPLDVRRAFTTKEWNVIKRVSGYLPYTIDDGLRGGDPELYVALAVIAMVRAQKVDREDAMRVADRLADEPFDRATITLEFPAVEDETAPLATKSDGSSASETSSESERSGETSSTSSAPSETTPASTGTTESDTPPTSAPVKLAI